jgi:alkylhydroperoxidase family enzyme
MEAASRLDRLSRAALALRQAVLDSPAETPVEVRRAAFAGGAPDPALADYVTLVTRQASRVTDAQVTALLHSGVSEDGIFEVTVAAAMGAAQRALDAGIALLESDAQS